MNNPDWAKVLHAFYRTDAGFEHHPEESIPRSVMEQLEEYDVDEAMVQTQLPRLVNLGLLEYQDEEVWIEELEERMSVTFLVLSKKGFDVAHERELTTNQNQTNLLLAILTAALFGTASIQALAAIYNVDGPERTAVIGGTLAVVILVIVLVFMIQKRIF